jgi:hypothetical protein
VFERLVTRWSVIENAKNIEADGEEEQECLENSSLRILTKEYLDLLNRLLEKSSGKGASNGSGDTKSTMDLDTEMESTSLPIPQGSSEVGEIGVMLLSDPICFGSIVNCIVS